MEQNWPEGLPAISELQSFIEYSAYHLTSMHAAVRRVVNESVGWLIIGCAKNISECRPVKWVFIHRVRLGDFSFICIRMVFACSLQAGGKLLMASSNFSLEELEVGRRLVESWALQAASSFIHSGNLLYAAGIHREMKMLREAKDLYIRGREFGEQKTSSKTKVLVLKTLQAWWWTNFS